MEKTENEKNGFNPPDRTKTNHTDNPPNTETTDNIANAENTITTDNTVVDENNENSAIGIEHIVNGEDDEDDEDDVSNDVVVDVDDDRGLIEQDDGNIVAWRIEGLYDDSGKVKRPRVLNVNPPHLIISDSLGNEASFLLTKNLSQQFSRSAEAVYKSYFGIMSKSVHESESSWRVKKALPIVIISLVFIIVLIMSQF